MMRRQSGQMSMVILEMATQWRRTEVIFRPMFSRNSWVDIELKVEKSTQSCLDRHLEDGRLELSNNRAERSIKPFVIGQKNFLFANTPLGARASAVIYSLIETAKENGLDPYRYLLWTCGAHRH